MEYIQGITLAEYIKTMEIGKIKGLVEALVASIVPKIQTDLTSEEQCKVIDVFNNKIANLRKLLENKKNDVINGSLDRLAQHDWSKLTPSPCHGDMTLENIIVKNDQLYFIDFLDSFYDSWFLDVGTLLQDVQVMWSYRFQKDISMGICNLRHLDEEITKRKKLVEYYRQRLSGIEGIKLSKIQKDVEPNYAYFPVVFDGYKYTSIE